MNKLTKTLSLLLLGTSALNGSGNCDKSAPTDACIPMYVTDTKALFVDYNNAQRVMAGAYLAYDLSGKANKGIQAANLIGALVATGGLCAASGCMIPAAMVGSFILMKTAQGIMNMEHIRRCNQLCTLDLAKSEAVKLKNAATAKEIEFNLPSSEGKTISKMLSITANQYNYNDFLSEYAGTTPASTSSSMTKQIRTSLAQTAEGLRNTYTKGADQGVKCLTTCAIGVLEHAALKVQKATEGAFKTTTAVLKELSNNTKSHPADYTCRLIENIPQDAPYETIIRLGQMLVLAHEFVSVRSAVEASRLGKFLRSTKQGQRCFDIADESKKDLLKQRITTLSLFFNRLSTGNEAPPKNWLRALRQTTLGRGAFLDAAKFGNLAQVQALGTISNVESADANYKTALHTAAKHATEDHFKIIKYLIENLDADPNALDAYGQTPLHIAVSDGGGRSTFGVLKNIGKAEQTEEQKAAQAAVRYKIVKLLIEKGSNAKTTDNDTNTPLHIAAKHGYLKIVRYLVNVGFASVHATNNKSKTPKERATDQGVKNFLTLCENFLGGAKTGDATKITQDALTKININIRNAKGQTPLMLVSSSLRVVAGPFSDILNHSRQEKGETVAKPDTDLNARDENGKTALIFAVEAKNTPIIMALLAKPALDLMVKDEIGRTAFHYATLGGDLSVLEAFLVKSDALDEKFKLLNLMDANGNSPLSLAAKEGLSEVIELFLSKASRFDKDITSLANYDGKTPLQLAGESGNVKSMKLLIEQGAPIVKEPSDTDTPHQVLRPYIKLFKAAKDGDLDKAKAALQEGASHNARNSKGQRALEIIEALDGATKENHDKIKELLQAQIDFLKAAKDGDLAKVNAALAKGANKDIKNKYNKNAKQIIQSLSTKTAGHTEILALL